MHQSLKRISHEKSCWVFCCEGVSLVSGDEPVLLIAELERRIAEQDRVIADLNEMVVAQWRKIDSLERRVGELRDEFDAAALARPDGREPPPPHY
mgnify:CR=1 FL=1